MMAPSAELLKLEKNETRPTAVAVSEGVKVVNEKDRKYGSFQDVLAFNLLKLFLGFWAWSSSSSIARVKMFLAFVESTSQARKKLSYKYCFIDRLFLWENIIYRIICSTCWKRLVQRRPMKWESLLIWLLPIADCSAWLSCDPLPKPTCWKS